MSGMDKLAKALVAAQKKMKHAPKNKKNPHFGNDYADLQSVIDTVMPIFLAEGISVTQHIDGDRLVTTVMHTSGEQVSFGGTIPVGKPGPQPFGSALTYMRRYTLQALAGIAAEDDDAEGATDRPKAKAKAKPKAAARPKPKAKKTDAPEPTGAPSTKKSGIKKATNF